MNQAHETVVGRLSGFSSLSSSGAARLRRETGNLPTLWQMSGYWVCWLTLALLVAYAASRMAQ